MERMVTIEYANNRRIERRWERGRERGWERRDYTKEMKFEEE